MTVSESDLDALVEFRAQQLLAEKESGSSLPTASPSLAPTSAGQDEVDSKHIETLDQLGIVSPPGLDQNHAPVSSGNVDQNHAPGKIAEC